MADKKEAPTVELPIVETIPSRAGGIAGLASANAPFLYFDGVAFYGNVEGVGQIALTANRPIAALEDGSIGVDMVVTANLRAPFVALKCLRDTIDVMLKKIEAEADAVAASPGPPTLN